MRKDPRELHQKSPEHRVDTPRSPFPRTAHTRSRDPGTEVTFASRTKPNPWGTGWQ